MLHVLSGSPRGCDAAGSCGWLYGDGGACLVEVEECAVQAVLVEVAAGHLDPSGVGDTTRLQRLEAGGIDEPFDRRRSRVVVGGVEEHGPLRLAICGAREGVRGERAECLYVVRAGREKLS